MKKSLLFYCFKPQFIAVLFAVSANSQVIPGTIAPGIEAKLDPVVTIPATSGTPRLSHVAHAGDGSGRVFVNEMQGKLYVIENGSLLGTPYLDLAVLYADFDYTPSNTQKGFSTFAFHPDFATNGLIYVAASATLASGEADYIGPRNGSNQPIAADHNSVILELQASNPAADTFSGTVTELLRVEQPYGDHNIGQVGFNPNATPGDPDYGMLYISFGDGGNTTWPPPEIDPLQNGQNPNNPLGTVLRIDPGGNNSPNGKYGIPASNPFVDDPSALDEVWAYGFRNPHRFSWDRDCGTGLMLISDIGQANVEEVNIVTAGANFGWRDREGTFITNPLNQSTVSPILGGYENENLGYTYPALQYDRDSWADSPVPNRSIVGGYVYRGKAFPSLYGKYVFGDFPVGRIFYVDAAELVPGQPIGLDRVFELVPLDGAGDPTRFGLITGATNERADHRFGLDEEGELYVTSKYNGVVYKVVPPAGTTESYPTWAAANISGGDNAISGNADFGALINGFEFAFHLDPENPLDDVGVLAGSLVDDGGDLFNTISFRRSRSAAGVLMCVQVSNDLLNWAEGFKEVEVVSRDDSHPDYILETARDLTPVAEGAARFIRLSLDVD